MVRVEKPLEPSGSGGFSLFPASPVQCRLVARSARSTGRRSLLVRGPSASDDRPTPTVPAFDRPMKKRVIRAEEFEVLDAAGHVRIRIGLSNDDSPFFSMLDPGGQVRARFGLSSDGSAGLAIGDDNGKVRATLGLSSDGSASLAFGDRNGKIRAKFGLASDASPTLGAHV